MELNALSELQEKLSQLPSLIALQLQAKEALRLLPREAGVPDGYLALTELPDGRMAVVPAGADLTKDATNNVSFFRAGPISLSIKAQPLRTSDGYDVGCSVTFRLAVRPNVNDLNGLVREFVKRNKPDVDLADVIKYLEEHVLVGARVFARGMSAAEILSVGASAAMADYLAESLERPLLSVGMALVPGMMISCLPVSEAAISFLQLADGGSGAPTPGTGKPGQGQEILHKALLTQFDDLAQRATACGASKVADAMLKLRDKVAGQTAFTTFDHVMQVLPERIRSEVYEALLKLFAADPAERLVAVAASQVICWKLPEVEQPAWKASLPSDLGGCRSVRIAKDLQQGKAVVLVGCQKGVAVLDPDTGNMTAMLLEPYRNLPPAAKEGSGFNSAILRRNKCWASKSDVGLLCWELDRPGAPYAVLGAGKNQAARFIRAVTVDAGEIIWFGADNWLVNCASGLPTAPELEWFVPIDSPVTCAEIDGEDIWLGTQAGGLWRISQFDPRSNELITVSPGQAVEAVTIRRTGMLRWLVYADGKSAAVRTVNGAYSRPLTGAGGIRAARTAGAWVAGLSDWRDSMILWNCSSLSKEPTKITIQRIANARIQDFDLG
jgi:hypothetical protein